MRASRSHQYVGTFKLCLRLPTTTTTTIYKLLSVVQFWLIFGQAPFEQRFQSAGGVYMKRHAALILLAILFAAAPCQAQFLKKLEQEFMGQGQQQQAVQPSVIGNVNLPPGQYLMTNTQSGQAFYVIVQNGQMFLTGQPGQTPVMTPALPQQQQQQQQQGGFGGMLKNGLGNFLKNELTPQQTPAAQ